MKVAQLRSVVPAAPVPALPVPARTWPVAPAPVPPTAPTTLPGPELPQVPRSHPALPARVSLADLEHLAATADPAWRITPGAHPSELRNAHYTNTRSQLAYALAGAYNSMEGDVRLRDGIPVMQHDGISRRDLTFEQWALLVHRAGRHLRIDVKETEALPAIEQVLRRHDIPSDVVTFNLSVGIPWSNGNVSPKDVAELRDRNPGAYFTVNQLLPIGSVPAHSEWLARRIGPDRLGITVMAGHVSRDLVQRLRRSFAFVSSCNEPRLGDIDIDAEARRLREIGVNGMVDLRRRSDPLAFDD